MGQVVRAVLGETFRLLGRHLHLFTLISLTVWLPTHVLLNYLEFFEPGEDSAGRALTIARRYRWPGSVLLDPKANIAAHLRLRSLPTTLFVSDGRILAAPTGVLAATSLERTYEALLSGR